MLGPNWPQNWECSRFINIGTFDILNILILILMSKMIFIKYLTPVRPKLVQKLKYSEFIESWHIRYFKYANLDFDVKRVFYIKYLPITRRQLVPKWKITLTNFIKFRTHFIHSNTPSFLAQIFAYPVLDLSPSKTMFCFKKLQTFLLLSSSFFLFFFLQCCASPSHFTILLSVLNIS